MKILDITAASFKELKFGALVRSFSREKNNLKISFKKRELSDKIVAGSAMVSARNARF
jgi:hypothetical protein